MKKKNKRKKERKVKKKDQNIKKKKTKLFSINPFKLYGTYIGMAIGLLLSFITYKSINVICEFSKCKGTSIILILIPLIIGFIAGWTIHGLINIIKE